MKKILFAALVLLFILILAACAPSGDGAVEPRIRAFEPDNVPEVYVIENNNFILNFYPHTTYFSITDKASGITWDSNPLPDPVATGLTKRMQQSLLVLTYSERNGVSNTLDSFRFSVDKGLYEYEVFDNGFEIHFTIGDIERVYYIPEAIPEWRMEELMADMDAEERRSIPNLYYRLYGARERVPQGETMAEIMERFPDLGKPLQELMNDFPEHSQAISDFMAKFPDITENRVYALRDMPTHLKARAEDLFESYGYSPDDRKNDNMFYNLVTEVTEPIFNITLRVELVGDRLNVSVPYDEIEYRPDYPPIELSVLPYFGAGSIMDEGYMLVPDGSGALINFNNGKGNQNPYFNRVYGWDEGIYREAIINDNKAHLPVFGIEKNGYAMFCVIEEGASYASIRADVSGARVRFSNYNNVYADYSLIHSDNLDISSKSNTAVLLFERNLPRGERILQSYFFPKNNGYMGMAETYRNYLLEKHPHLAKAETSQVPVAVEITGAVNRVQHILGLPFDRPFKLTTYNEAADIVNDLTARGFDDVNYRLSGWFNGSVQHSVPTSVRTISRLGSRKDLKNLIGTVNNNGSFIYMEADFLFMRDNRPFNGFNTTRDASRYVNRKRIQSYPYSFIWFGERTRWGKLAYLARPDFMMQTIDGFVEKISPFGAENISFRTIGNNLAGDYNERRHISREASMNMQIEKLGELHAAGNGIMLQSGYIYAAPYADFITDFPLTWQGFGILDVEIPFYQIVIHGLIPYAGRPVNLAEDYDLNILRTLETGAGLYFHFMHENPVVLQSSRFLTYYANQYSMWADTAEALLKEFDELVGSTYNQYIKNYLILSDCNNVSLTEYENGVQVYVNKSRADFNHNGLRIPAMDYLVRGGGR